MLEKVYNTESVLVSLIHTLIAINMFTDPGVWINPPDHYQWK